MSARMKHPLREYIEKNEKSQGRFALKVGVTPGALSRYLNGTRKPKLAIALGISRATGIPVLELLYTVKELRAK